MLRTHTSAKQKDNVTSVELISTSDSSIDSLTRRTFCHLAIYNAMYTSDNEINQRRH